MVFFLRFLGPVTILVGDISILGCSREQGGRALCAEETESLSEVSIMCSSVGADDLVLAAVDVVAGAVA